MTQTSITFYYRSLKDLSNPTSKYKVVFLEYIAYKELIHYVLLHSYQKQFENNYIELCLTLKLESFPS